MPGGRPTLYNDDIADRICTEIATHAEGLESICNRNAEFPQPSTVYAWIIKHPEFAEKYTRARQHQAQILADQIFTIADTTQRGETVTIKADGEERTIKDMTDHRRLRIDARKFLAMKLLPRIYGEKVQTEHTGDVTLKVVHVGEEE